MFLATDCTERKVVCDRCAPRGQTFYERSLRACDTCVEAGTQCKKLLVLTWVADCEENNKKAMKIMMSSEDESLPFLQPLPEAVHAGKCMKSSFANWFLLYDGQRFNLSNLRVLYNDCSDAVKNAVREAVTLSAVRNRDRISVHDLLLITQDRLVDAVSRIASIVQTVVPETFRLHKGIPRVFWSTLCLFAVLHRVNYLL